MSPDRKSDEIQKQQRVAMPSANIKATVCKRKSAQGGWADCMRTCVVPEDFVSAPPASEHKKNRRRVPGEPRGPLHSPRRNPEKASEPNGSRGPSSSGHSGSPHPPPAAHRLQAKEQRLYNPRPRPALPEPLLRQPPPLCAGGCCHLAEGARKRGTGLTADGKGRQRRAELHDLCSGAAGSAP